MDDESYYVVLETGAEERFFTESELKTHLAQLLAQEQRLEGEALVQAVEQLLATACELPLEAGRYCQWYATRIDHPSGRQRSW